MNTELGQFLRTRRAKVEPHEVGLPTDDHRRVPGLRREELAQLARVSLDYYARLEQGRQATASASVLDSIARALRLTTDEHSHLYDLAGVEYDRTARASARPAPDTTVQRFIDLLGDTPALLRGAYSDIVSVNRAAAFLFADFNRMPARERNGLRWMLLAPEARDLYGPGWQAASSEMIGRLRLDAGRTPDHPRLVELVEELHAKSELFRQVWQDRHVSAWLHDRKPLYHGTFGVMDFFTELVTVKSAPGQTLVVMIPADPAAFRAALNSVSGG